MGRAKRPFTREVERVPQATQDGRPGYGQVDHRSVRPMGVGSLLVEEDIPSEDEMVEARTRLSGFGT